jgi:hypothetical protein
MHKREKLYINHSLNIQQGKVLVDGDTLYEAQNGENIIALNKRIFRSLDNAYSKFHKMDRVSKLAYIASELLLSKTDLESLEKEQVATLFANSSATIETDVKFQKSIEGIPSPGLFVYTLPNIMVGEICIRFGFKGENLFFVEPEFHPQLFYTQLQLLFKNSDTQLCIIGWVDFYSTEKYNCYMAIVSKKETGSLLTEENLYSQFKR